MRYPLQSFSLLLFFLMASTALYAQNDTLNADDNIDYSQFGDASGVRRYATQKVINQSPTRIVSIGYEYHGGFFDA